MALRYKVNVLTSLKDAGYTTYRLRVENILWETVITQLRNGEMVSWENLDTICKCLDCQPGDLIEHITEI